MRIIEPSFTILDELDQQSLPVRIEYCGRICYKSEDRIDASSAVPFVRKMAEYGHNSVLEMGGATLQVTAKDTDAVTALLACQPKFLQIDQLATNRLLITASIRAFRELAMAHPANAIAAAMVHFLSDRDPYFFESLISSLDNSATETISIEQLSLKQIEQLPLELLTNHRYLAIRFVVNRAVTHELVRHRPCSFLQESQRYCRYSTDKFGNEVTFIKPLFYEEGSPEFTIWQQAMAETEQHYLRLLETSSPQAARTVLPNACKTEIIVYANLAEWRHILSLRATQAADPSMREVMIPLQEVLQSRYPLLFS